MDYSLVKILIQICELCKIDYFWLKSILISQICLINNIYKWTFFLLTYNLQFFFWKYLLIYIYSFNLLCSLVIENVYLLEKLRTANINPLCAYGTYTFQINTFLLTFNCTCEYTHKNYLNHGWIDNILIWNYNMVSS